MVFWSILGSVSVEHFGVFQSSILRSFGAFQSVLGHLRALRQCSSAAFWSISGALGTSNFLGGHFRASGQCFGVVFGDI